MCAREFEIRIYENIHSNKVCIRCGHPLLIPPFLVASTSLLLSAPYIIATSRAK